MTEFAASSPNVIRRTNRGQVLRSILTGGHDTRVDIAAQLGLTKTTLTNIVSEMTSLDILTEVRASARPDEETKLGRRSIHLALSPKAPLILGLIVLRRRMTAVLGTMDGQIAHCITKKVPRPFPIAEFGRMLGELFDEAMAAAQSPVFAVSVVCLGPLDCESGILLEPTEFYTECSPFPLREFLRERTNLPIYITHDAAAAAMAERLYGEAHACDNFLFISLEDGIGAGFFLDGHLYSGPFGQNGEIGHTSIRFDGEKCPCGNHGCLELYANVTNLKKSAEKYRMFLPDHPIYNDDSTIFSLIAMADEGDTLARELMKEYCQYLSYGLINAITLLNLRQIFLGVSQKAQSGYIESVLGEMLSKSLASAQRQPVQVMQSRFGTACQQYGAIAIVMSEIFSGQLFPGETA